MEMHTGCLSWLMLLFCIVIIKDSCLCISQFRVLRDQSYDPDVPGECGGSSGCPSCRCMDIYTTTSIEVSNLSIVQRVDPIATVLFFHGGLWYSGKRGELEQVCNALVKHNIVCATADYHYSQDLGGCC